MLRDTIKRAKGKSSSVGLDAALAFMKNHRVPAPIVRTLRACAIAQPVQVGPLVLFPLARLQKENAGLNKVALAHGFLIMGRGTTGDPVAVELRTGEMAFLSHDILWEHFDPEVTAFDEAVARSTLGIDAFWKLALEESTFPADFYAARG